MAIRNLIRLSGLALLLGGVIWAIGSLLHPNNYDPGVVLNHFWRPAHVAEGLTYLLSVFGLVGLYLRQAEMTGRLGLIGFVLALFGSAALVSVALLLEVYIFPLIATQQATPKPLFDLIDPPSPFAELRPVPFLSVAFFDLGFVLTGIATMRAGALPRWAGLLLIIGPILTDVSFLGLATLSILRNIGGVLFGFGLGWLGYALWSEKGDTYATAQARPTQAERKAGSP